MTTENNAATHTHVVVYLAKDPRSSICAWATAKAPRNNPDHVAVASGLSDAGTSTAIMEVLETVVLNRTGPVDLFTAETSTFEAATYLSTRVRGLTAHLYTTTRPHPMHLQAMNAAQKALAAAPAAPVPQADRVVVATDGSWSRHNKVAGCGVMFADGRWGATAHRDFPSALAAELKAVEHAVNMADKDEPLLILCDSRPAIHALRNGATAKNKIGFLESLRAKIARRDIELVWVKGHAGYALNEAADRLAVASRRNFDSNTDPQVRDRIYANIVDDAAAHGLLAVPA